MEILARFNERDERIGEATRDDAHANGYWHETFHCWFVGTKDDERIVYLQLRSAQKKDYPSHYDITAAGHLLSTETVANGVREISEEIGIDVTLDDLRAVGTIPNIVQTPMIDDREWARCYVYDVDVEPTFTLQREEVDTLVTCKVSDFQKLISHTVEAIEITDVFTSVTSTLIFGQLVPHPQSYFEAIAKVL